MLDVQRLTFNRVASFAEGEASGDDFCFAQYFSGEAMQSNALFDPVAG